MCAGCRFLATRKRDMGGGLGPLEVRRDGQLWHYQCWHRYWDAAVREGRMPAGQSGSRGEPPPAVIVESKATRVSVMWMVFIVVVLAILLLICFTSTITFTPTRVSFPMIDG